MTTSEEPAAGRDRWGGRLPLVGRAGLDADQRRLDTELRARLLPWSERVGFTATTADGAFVGPMNIYLHRPRLFRTFVAWLHGEQDESSLSPRVREVVILTVATSWGSAFVLSSHERIARRLGVTEPMLDAIRAGGPLDGAPTAVRVAHATALQLLERRRLTDDTYRRATDVLGVAGTIDLVALVGAYLTACALVNTFEVPAP